MSRSFILTYFSRSFMVSVHTFTSLMHFKLIFVSHVRYGSSFILSHVVVRLLGHAWLCDPMGCSMPGSSVLLAVAAAAAVSSVVSNSVWPHERQPTRLRRPWDSPGKNTGVGCHFLLQCMKVKSQSRVTQSCPTLSDPMNCSLPGSSVHGIFQAKVLEWVAIAFSAISWSLLKFMSIELVMLSNLYHHPLPRPLLLPWIFLSIRVFPNESALCIRWPKYWSFSFRISFSIEYSGLISFKIDLFNYPRMIFWRACLFSIGYSWLPCQILVDWICLGLFMGSPFCSIGVFVCFYASTKRYWWPQLYHIAWNQEMW